MAVRARESYCTDKGKAGVTMSHTWTGTDRAQLKDTRREGEPERNAYGNCDNVNRVFVGIVYMFVSESVVYLQRNNAEWTINYSDSSIKGSEEVGVSFRRMCELR
jgi:hypothetical protein